MMSSAVGSYANEDCFFCPLGKYAVMRRVVVYYTAVSYTHLTLPTIYSV